MFRARPTPRVVVWVFERLTRGARRAVALAQEQARGLRHNYIGTEHLLLGLLQDGDDAGVAGRVFASLGVTADDVALEPGEGLSPGHIPFTPQAKKVLELGLRESLNLGHNYVGTEHLLLALPRDGECAAAKVLARLGIGREVLRALVLDELCGEPLFNARAKLTVSRPPGVSVYEFVKQAVGEIVGSTSERSAAASLLRDFADLIDPDK